MRVQGGRALSRSDQSVGPVARPRVAGRRPQAGHCPCCTLLPRGLLYAPLFCRISLGARGWHWLQARFIALRVASVFLRHTAISIGHILLSLIVYISTHCLIVRVTYCRFSTLYVEVAVIVTLQLSLSLVALCRFNFICITSTPTYLLYVYIGILTWMR